ncbi:MAG: ABC transporter ATP-binding protein [Stellaceae bacterium]
MLDVRHLCKRFGSLVAVDDISFIVPPGEVLGFLGPNGAGKSTTMKMITGFLAPDSGTAVICGHDIAKEPIAAKRAIGYLPEGAPAYPDMTPADFLDFIARIRGFSGIDKRRRIGRIVEMIHIDEVLNQPIETLSKGYKRRVGVAQALLHDPPVILLDEPTDGLDPNQKHEMRKVIAALQAEKAIILSTHLLEEVEAVCSRAIIIARGRLLADDTPAALRARSRWEGALRLSIAEPERSAIAAELAQLPAVAAIERMDDGDGPALVLFPRERAAPLAAVAEMARARGWAIGELRVERGRLDDVFRDITTTPALSAVA